jgi:hypothetical protein
MAEAVLTPERSREINDLLNTVLACEPAERKLLLDKTAEEDPGLWRDLATAIEETEADRSVISSATTVAPIDTPHVSVEFAGTDRFFLERRLGAGGFGRVYQAYDREWKLRVALKVLRRNDPKFLYRFKREFRGSADFNHPNLVKLHELFADGQCWFFTMELLRGNSFLDYVQYQRGKLCNLERLRPALYQLAQAISLLHQHGKLHRDIKPGNVIVTMDGRVVLLDFGLMWDAAFDGDQQVTIAGTPAYMSPEQISAQRLDQASDWYAVGVMLFQALTGSLPFAGAFLEMAAKKLSSDIPRPSDRVEGVPEDLDQLCSKLLEREPSERPEAWEILDRLGLNGRSEDIHTDVRAASEGGDLVGRETHLAQLEELFHLVLQGKMAVGNLQGKSGMGKSTLLQAFLQRVKSKQPDAVVLQGRCHENEMVPFKALDDLVDALTRHLMTLSEMEVEAILPREAELLGKLFPVLRQLQGLERHRKVIAPGNSQELRQRAFEALHELLLRLADRVVVVLALDDLQWGDPDSAAFFESLLAGKRQAGMLLIASYRSEDLTRNEFLKSYLSKVASRFIETRTIEVGELTPSESRELAARILGEDGAAPSAGTLAEECSGSPFLIEQFARYRAELALGDRGGLRELMGARLGLLSAPSRLLLELISLAGQPLPEAVLHKAAAIEEGHYTAFSQLLADRLIRIHESAGVREVEAYHDKIRESVVAEITPECQVARHRSLATALESLPAVDPALLAFHFEHAGSRKKAASYAITAAENAAKALAFDRAAQFYRQAIGLGAEDWSDKERLERQKNLAQVLVNAGRGVEAAALYLATADFPGVDQLQRMDLRRRSAEQYLRSGHLAEGEKLIGAIAKELKIRLAEKPWQALLSLLWHRSLLELRGLKFKEVSHEDVPVDILTRLEVYHVLAQGLSCVDVVRGADFNSRHLLLALRTGEPNHVAISLAFEAAHSMCPSWRNEKRARALVDTAEQIGTRLGNRRVIGISAVVRAACAWGPGNWKQVHELGELAEKVLRERPVGMAWEVATNHVFWLSSLIYLGEWREYADRLPALVAEATDLADVFGTTSLLLLNGAYTLDLVSDNPHRARELIASQTQKMPTSGFYLQHFWAMYGQAETALYEGNGALAWSVLDENRRALARSQLLRVQALNLFALQIRGRSNLAMAVINMDQSKQFLSEASRAARIMRKEKMPWSDGLALLIEAGVAATSDCERRATELLMQAESFLVRSNMAQYLAACRFRLGQLIGGPDGGKRIAMAREWMVGQGIIRPESMLHMLAPGRWSKS